MDQLIKRIQEEIVKTNDKQTSLQTALQNRRLDKNAKIAFEKSAAELTGKINALVWVLEEL